MVPVEDVLKIILDSVKPQGDESISIFEASERYLYEDVFSNVNIPSFKNSAMDGYAIISGDVGGAEKDNAVELEIIDEIQAGGDYKDKEVKSNTAIRIMTGAPMPAGADSVIPVEDTDEENGFVKIYRNIKKNENVRFAGEDISKGQCVLTGGEHIGSAELGLLASLNYENVKVFRKPRVAILSTGNEIIDIGEEMKGGQVRNSNAYTLYSEIKKCSGMPKYLGIARDTFDDTYQKINDALKNDIVIATGGVSMGKYDFVKEVIDKIGIEIKVEKVKMKPGKPVVFGTVDDKLFFGLPGNPVSTMISFIQFVRPAILKSMGAKKIEKPVVNAILKEDIQKKPDRRNYIRGVFQIEDGKLFVSTTGAQGSGILKSMSIANCLIIIPEKVGLVKAGETVSVQLFNHKEI
ncbi:gephyrin-like molybdotransferase Glp [Spirochaetota bacterium]